MPNRYIRESAIESEGVNALTWQGEVFYRRLLNRVDDFGRFTANKELLRSKIFPLQLARVSAADVGRLLKQCEDAGLVFTYNVSGKDLLVINRWEKGRAKHSDYPDPPGEVLERMQTYVYRCKHMSANVPDSDTDSDTDPDADKRARPNGSRPTAEQWATFCAMSFPDWTKSDFESAFNHYEAVGWRYGKAPGKPVRDWEACARTCYSRFKNPNPANSSERNSKNNPVRPGANGRAYTQTDDYSRV